MTRYLTALVAAVLLLPAPPAARAHPTYHYAGECGFVAMSDGTDSDDTVWTGVVEVRVVATDDLGVPRTPVPISVDCILSIAATGTETSVLSASGVGAAVGAGPLEFEAHPDDWVYLCAAVTVGTEFHGEQCPGANNGTTTTPVLELFEFADRIVCREIGKAAPGIPGVVDVTPAGDVYVDGVQVKECRSRDVFHNTYADCHVLRRNAPGAPPAVDIRPDGDLYVAGAWMWDCPPYGT